MEFFGFVCAITDSSKIGPDTVEEWGEMGPVAGVAARDSKRPADQ